MQVLVDTCIWSYALRRYSQDAEHTLRLTELINENRVRIIGPIRQELLSGIREESHFKRLKEKLSAFADTMIETKDYECAAEFCNKLRKKGIQGSAIDYLICAVAAKHKFAIYTTDKDFKLYQKYVPIDLYKDF